MLKIAKTGVALLLSLGMALPIVPMEAKAETSMGYQELNRDQFHFSTQQNWINDPNGLIKIHGVYNMYYQYNPFGNQWGNMAWGHATSTDLVHWKEQPVAIPESDDNAWVDFWMQTKDDTQPVHYIGRPTTNWDGGNPNGNRYIFSGSIIEDKNNVAGFGKNTLVAFYTSTYQVAVRDNDYSKDSLGNYLGVREVQEQNMAYSTDGGQTFTKYNHQNPIIPVTKVPTGDADNFRDPKVVYDAAAKEWIMPVVSGQEIDIFASTNLKDWTFQSTIKRENDVGNGVWECPELEPMRVAGTGRTKWVLTVSVQQGAPAGGSGMQYFVGSFNGKTFTPETAETMKHPQWLDYGEDFYAGVTYGNTPGRAIMQGWMSNWNFVDEQQTTPWHGEMTLPRELTLVKRGPSYQLRQKVIPEITQQLAQQPVALITHSEKISAASGEKQIKNFSGTQYKVSADFSWNRKSTPDSVGLRLREAADGSRYVQVGYNPKTGVAFLDRTKDGEGINRTGDNAPIDRSAQKVRLTVYVDTSSIEVFVNDGEKVLTQVVYPNPNKPSDSRGLSFFVKGGSARIDHAVARHLKSAWGNNPSIAAPDKETVSYGSAFNPMAGVRARDPKDGDLTSSVIISGDKVNTKRPGKYWIVYHVANQAGITADQRTLVTVAGHERK
ncbi:MAG: GH32 C-terminal domain-containing protein [Sporolactobacillus sp.]